MSMSLYEKYEKDGHVVFRNLLSDEVLNKVEAALLSHHNNWLRDNADFYESRAVNSYNLTGLDYLDAKGKQTLFQLIASDIVSSVVNDMLGPSALFIGTQLFFDPKNSQQKNYWHRDIQYNSLSIDQQKAALLTQNPLHFRIPLRDERGIELVPETHRRWDTDEEFNIRMNQHGHNTYDDISGGIEIPLSRGDMCVFSANMIHRGLYGNDRLALDLLFADPDMVMKEYIQQNCLPKQSDLCLLQDSFAIQNTISLLASK